MKRESKIIRPTRFYQYLYSSQLFLKKSQEDSEIHRSNLPIPNSMKRDKSHSMSSNKGAIVLKRGIQVQEWQTKPTISQPLNLHRLKT